MQTRPAVFLDRDGTLMEEVDYCSRAEDVDVFPDVVPALKQMCEAGFLLIIVTNQAGIGRGIFQETDYYNVHAELLRQIGPGLIDATYFCAEHPATAGPRRKPGIGMIEEACVDFAIDLPNSWIIGDKTSDIVCGQNVGLRTILVETGYGQKQTCTPDFRVKDFATATRRILGTV